MKFTELEKICVSAKLVCDVCGKARLLDYGKLSAYVSNGWPEHCGQTMRLITRAEQTKGEQGYEKTQVR